MLLTADQCPGGLIVDTKLTRLILLSMQLMGWLPWSSWAQLMEIRPPYHRHIWYHRSYNLYVEPSCYYNVYLQVSVHPSTSTQNYSCLFGRFLNPWFHFSFGRMSLIHWNPSSDKASSKSFNRVAHSRRNYFHFLQSCTGKSWTGLPFLSVPELVNIVKHHYILPRCISTRGWVEKSKWEMVSFS